MTCVAAAEEADVLAVAAILAREIAGAIRLAHVIVTTVTAPEVVVLRADDGTSDSREEDEEEVEVGEEEVVVEVGVRVVLGGVPLCLSDVPFTGWSIFVF